VGWDPDPEQTRDSTHVGQGADQRPKDRVPVYQLNTQLLTRRTGNNIGGKRSVQQRWSRRVLILRVAHGRLQRAVGLGLGLVPAGRGTLTGGAGSGTRLGLGRISTGSLLDETLPGQLPTPHQLWHCSNSDGTPVLANPETSRW
jgi:hypothetical protein